MALETRPASNSVRPIRSIRLAKMQLLSLSIYNASGARRDVRFKPGRLNIVTGGSKSGKSALLDMIEYCLGRDTIMMPIGPITLAVKWYAALLQLPAGGRAFVARPAPREGAASSQQAMLEFGGLDLAPLPPERLIVNCDTKSLREQLGRRIGIEENVSDPGEFSLRSPLEAGLGHAVMLCLQGQDEIANRNLLFHRQAETGIEQALKDALPYFLGAVPRDQALKRLQLREAKRELKRLTNIIESARTEADAIEAQVQALATEAIAVGLMEPVGDNVSRSEVVAALQLAAATPLRAGESAPSGADSDRRASLDRARRQLSDELKSVAAERRLLLDAEVEENSYRTAVGTHIARLASLDLIPNIGDGSAPPDVCPLCASELAQPDADVEELSASLNTLRAQLSDLEAARPTRRTALTKLEARAGEIRDELRAVEAARRAIVEGDELTSATEGVERVEFTRGRISALLGVSMRSDTGEIDRLVTQANVLQRRVALLDAELDDDEAAMQLDSRLLEVSATMTSLAQQLSLEHTGLKRLDLAKMTVITETDQGPAPLWRIGSAENWIGAHLVAHLALHRFFVQRSRPVPRLLVLDQPTQAWYPSEIDEWDGVPVEDSDGEAVRAIFRLLLAVTSELAPEFQIIVCDHANLPEEWFQEAVEHKWRGGEKLVPAGWLTAE